MARARTRAVAEFGDFQTPPPLAEAVCRTLIAGGEKPATVVEPTCGTGNFLVAAVRAFPEAARAIGVDINPGYVASARQKTQSVAQPAAEVAQGDFFCTEWKDILLGCPEPILVVGNPPWVTNGFLSALGSTNLPQKANDYGLTGFEAAMSGKSNFDISEWMLIRLLEWLSGRTATVALLCKTAVARKGLLYAWRHNLQVAEACMHSIDARAWFGASVDACLLVCRLRPGGTSSGCLLLPDLSPGDEGRRIGFADGHLVADLDSYLRWRGLNGKCQQRWRSGLKHDCAPVMELKRAGKYLTNGLGEHVDIEETLLFPLYKSSDIANRRIGDPSRYVLVPQAVVGAETADIQRFAPRTWNYLCSHGQRLDGRRSIVYSKQPRFAVFGVGDYTFAPWKVAVSGLYKQLRFVVVPPVAGKPAVLDDTCYFLPAQSQEEAQRLQGLFTSGPAMEFYQSLLFADAKRPVTVDLLGRLDLLALQRSLDTSPL